MKILVIGKNGQVGQCLLQILQDKPEIDSVAFDSQSLDITKPDTVNVIVSEHNPDFIINAAAYTAVDKAESEPEYAYSVNCDGPRNLANAAKDNNAILLHISTDYVFDGSHSNAYDELAPVGPKSIYGASKLAGENAIAEVTDEFIILRTAWVFSEFGNNFVKTMLKLGQTRTSLGIVSDQFGGPTCAVDIAKALINIAEQIFAGSTHRGIYHYAGEPHVSWYEFAERIFTLAHTANLIENEVTLSPLTTADYPTPAQRPANSKLNCQKITSDFKIQPSDWQKALNAIHVYH